MRTVALAATGERVPALGIGTWRMGENRSRRAAEVSALRRAIELGATLIDTAEMYGEGGAEEVVASAIEAQRDAVFLVSKVYPHNASRTGAVAACERSLKRLRTDRIDLYLLHWRGDVPLAETLEAFLELQRAGKIRHYGVSNLDLSDMKELWDVSGGKQVVTNQLLYNLARRGIEWDLLPWLRERSIPVMAYSPLEQGRLLANEKLQAFATQHGMSAAHAALGWLLAKPDVIVIPKSAAIERVEDNVAAAEITLTAAQLAELDAIFPPPRRAQPLEML